jgi:hypothetical protein
MFMDNVLIEVAAESVHKVCFEDRNSCTCIEFLSKIIQLFFPSMMLYTEPFLQPNN